MKTNIFRPKIFSWFSLATPPWHWESSCLFFPTSWWPEEPPDFSDHRSLSASADFCLCVYLQLHHVLLGALILGFDFALTTLISTFYYPIALGFFQNIPSLSTITDDRMLSSIFGGLFIGFSLGIVIRCGASTGGMDIPPLILNKKFGLPVSVMLYVFDFLILIGQALFCDKEAILYGILLVMTYTIVLG